MQFSVFTFILLATHRANAQDFSSIFGSLGGLGDLTGGGLGGLGGGIPDLGNLAGMFDLNNFGNMFGNLDFLSSFNQMFNFNGLGGSNGAPLANLGLLSDSIPTQDCNAKLKAQLNNDLLRPFTASLQADITDCEKKTEEGFRKDVLGNFFSSVNGNANASPLGQENYQDMSWNAKLLCYQAVKKEEKDCLALQEQACALLDGLEGRKNTTSTEALGKISELMQQSIAVQNSKQTCDSLSGALANPANSQPDILNLFSSMAGNIGADSVLKSLTG